MGDFLKIFLIAAVGGVLLFVLFASRLTTVEHPDVVTADQRFRAALAQFEDPTPLRSMDGYGHVVHHVRTQTALIPSAPVDVIVLHWGGPELGLIETRLPIWFLGLKDPALRFILRDTSFDPRKWGLSVAEIRNAGPGVVIDHRGGGGTRTLVWSD